MPTRFRSPTRTRARRSGALRCFTGTRSRHQRSQVLEAIAARIAEAAEEVAHLITWESGLALVDARHEIGRSIDVFRPVLECVLLA